MPQQHTCLNRHQLLPPVTHMPGRPLLINFMYTCRHKCLFKPKSVFKKKYCLQLETIHHNILTLFRTSGVNCFVKEELASLRPKKPVLEHHIMHNLKEYAKLTPYKLHIQNTSVTHILLACLTNFSSSHWNTNIT